MSILNSPVLVLNKGWTPVNVKSLEKLLSKIFGGKARLMDGDTLIPYSWEQWVDTFSIDFDDEEDYDYKWINGVSTKIRLPEIIVLNKYNKVYRNSVRLSRKNLYIRDKFICQYCGNYLKLSEATIDHVIPKRAGGKKIWTNVALACQRCNLKKADRTPEQAGMKLKREPRPPSWHPLYNLIVPDHPESWNKFIGSSKS